MKNENKIRRAWINGNLISFEKPKNKGNFFDIEEVLVVKVKTEKSNLTKKQEKMLDEIF